MHIITTSLLLVIASQILVSAEEWRANKKPQLIPAEMFEIDPSLEVKVWATTPMLYNPTNMDIDHKGRCWVTEGVNYRGRNGTRPKGTASLYCKILMVMDSVPLTRLFKKRA